MAMRFPQIIAAALVALGAAVCPAAGRGIPVDGYAAMVNTRVITVGEVLALVQPVRAQIERSFEGDELELKLEEAYNASLRSLIERALILEDFSLLGGNLPDRLVDDQISSFISERFDNSRVKFLEALTEERMTLDEWREETRNRLIVSIMRRREVTDRVLISPRDVRDLYESRIEQYRLPEQVRLRMIALNRGATEEDWAAKRAEAEKIRERLLAGEDFAETARTESEGARAAEGGDFGWIEPNSLRAELAAVVADLDTGRISEVIETDDELYILRIEARKNAAVKPFDEVRGSIEDELRRKEEARLYASWMERLYRKFHVRILDDESPSL